MDKEKDKEQKTVKKDFGGKKYIEPFKNVGNVTERELRDRGKAAQALKSFIKDNTID